MTVMINQKGGMKEMTHDADFSFENRRCYLENTVLMPGDTMSTTCT